MRQMKPNPYFSNWSNYSLICFLVNSCPMRWTRCVILCTTHKSIIGRQSNAFYAILLILTLMACLFNVALPQMFVLLVMLAGATTLTTRSLPLAIVSIMVSTSLPGSPTNNVLYHVAAPKLNIATLFYL